MARRAGISRMSPTLPLMMGRSPSDFRSTPALKARPAPVTTTARTSSSSPAASIALPSASSMPGVSAFSASGRFSVMVVTPSLVSVSSSFSSAIWRCLDRDSHVAAVLAAHIVQGPGYLTQGTRLHGLHEFFEDVAAGPGHFPEPLQRLAAVADVVALERAHRVDLCLLLLVVGAHEFQRAHLVLLPLGRQKSVHADDRQAAVVLAALVVQALVLDLAALVHRVHGAQHTATLGDALELLVDGLLHQVGELVDDERALPGVLAVVQAQLPVDDELDGHRPPHRLLRGRGNGLVEGIRVQAVAVVEQGVERLQCGADVVEADFLGVQAAPGG